MSVTAPLGFRAAGVAAGLKASGERDVAVVLYVLLALAWLVVAMRTVLFALDGQPRSQGQPRSDGQLRSSAPTRSPASDTAAARTSATSAAVSVRSGARKRSA